MISREIAFCRYRCCVACLISRHVLIRTRPATRIDPYFHYLKQCVFVVHGHVESCALRPTQTIRYEEPSITQGAHSHSEICDRSFSMPRFTPGGHQASKMVCLCVIFRGLARERNHQQHQLYGLERSKVERWDRNTNEQLVAPKWWRCNAQTILHMREPITLIFRQPRLQSGFVRPGGNFRFHLAPWLLYYQPIGSPRSSEL